MSAQQYYQILGVSPRAGWQEIRRRYRALAWQYHPDRNPDDPTAAARFRQVAQAYEALQESRTRRPRTAAQNYRQPEFTGQEDFFEEFFGISRPSAGLQESPGANFRYDLQISLAAALRGMETVINVPHTLSCLHCRGSGLAPGTTYQSCPDCQGRGRRFGGPGLLRYGPICGRCRGRGLIVAQACGHCNGLGYYGVMRQYHLQIPAGTQDGARLRLPGEGGQGFHNGPPGNLEVVIQIEPHEFFTRVGNDLYCQVKVSFVEAALGARINIPTLDGFKVLDLPRGTQSGRIFRFPGGGVPAGPHRRAGDQVMEVVVTTPEHLSHRQREILEEMVRLEQAGNE
jgi:molecular chaperone DnaJ